MAALVLVLVLFAPAAVGARRAPGWEMDEGSVLVYPDLVHHGRWPHRDFETFYGPGNVWALAGVYAFTGPTLTAERTAGLVYRLALVLAVFLLARRAGAVVAAASAAVAALLALSVTLIAFAWFGGLALALLGACCVASRRWAMAGVLWGLALVFRLDLAVGLVPATAVALAHAPPAGRRRLLAGLTVGGIGYAVHVAVAGPRAVVRGMVLDLLRQNAGRRLPVPPHDGQVAALLVLVVVGVVALVLAGILRRLRGERDEGALLVVLGLVCAGGLPQALQRAEAVHTVFAAAGAVSLLPLALSRLSLSLPRAAAVAVALPVAALAVVGAPVPGREVDGFTRDALGIGHRHFATVHRDGRSFVLHDRREAGELRALLTDVSRRSKRGQRLFVGPANLRRTNYNDTYLYGLLPELKPATYYLEMNPRSANRPGSRLATDLASADVVVLTTAYDGWDEPNDSVRDGSAAPVRVLARRFCPAARHGPWRLLLRCR